MVSHSTIKQSIQKIEFAFNHEEQLFKVLEIYLQNFPVLDAYLLRYSPLGFLAEGLIYLNLEGGVHIGEIRDDVRNFPIIYSAIKDKEAKYCSGIEYLKLMNSKYTITSTISNTFVVIPIFDGPVVFGYICSSEFKEGTNMDEKMLSYFTFFGKLVGKVMNRSENGVNANLLSRREMEVMKRIALGESTKEMADSMGISAVTVNQYVKTAIKKLGVKNRSHAIGELYRRGVIF